MCEQVCFTPLPQPPISQFVFVRSMGNLAILTMQVSPSCIRSEACTPRGGVDSNGLKSHSCHLLNRVFLKSRTPTDKPYVYVCAFATLHSGVAQWLACWAHNPKVHGSRPCSAIARNSCFAPPQQTGTRRRTYKHLQQTLFFWLGRIFE